VRAFETQRLHLRPLQTCDEELYCGLYTDSETMRYIGRPLSQKRALGSFGAVIAQPRPPNGPFLFAMCDKVAGMDVGLCAVVQLLPTTMSAEVGVMLKSHARGRGYAREGLAGLVESTFLTYPTEAVWVQCSALNPLVERMVKSIGFALDDVAAVGVGPLLQRTWTVRRLSWCFVDPTYHRGENNVEDCRLS
jgi:RimJ/RimL family protein N-acetyltransferase